MPKHRWAREGNTPLTGTSLYPESGAIHTGATYYPNGLQQTVTDGRNTVTAFGYHAYGTPKTAQTSSHPAITYSYDQIGRMKTLTDQVQSKTEFDYDKRGLPKWRLDPLTRTNSFTYYNDGKLCTSTDRNASTTTYAYTPSDKLEKVTYPNATFVSFTYSNLDLPTSMQDGLGTTTYTLYDAADRLTSMTDPHSFAISYQYDEAGNVKQITYPGNKNVIYTYDALNRLQTVKIAWLNRTATYNYKDKEVDLLDNLVHFNGIATSCTYDAGHRLTGITSPVASYTFTLDGNGNRTQIVQTEPLVPVVTACDVSYAYNAKRNRLTSAEGTTFTYDNEGRILTGYGSSYTFDYEHRLTGIGSDCRFYYDGRGTRLKAVRNGATTYYIYDAGGNLLAEADDTKTITRYYIYGGGLLAMATSTNQMYCYHYNATGSTIALTDQSQTVVNKYAYDSFGKTANQVEAVTQPFKFVGQFGVMTEPNGFYYMRARYYDPNVGRFVSEDPSGFGGGDVNLFGYVGNNPIMFIDPLGLCSVGINWTSGFVGINVPVYNQNSGWGGSPTLSASTNLFAFSGNVSFNNPLNPPTRDTSNDVFVRVRPLQLLPVSVSANMDLSRISVSLGISTGIPRLGVSTSLETATKAAAEHIIGPAIQTLANGIERGLKWITGQ